MSARIPAAAARQDFASVVRKISRGERVKLTRYNKTVAVLVSKSDLQRLEDCEAASHKPAPPSKRAATATKK